ncbi:MbtH family protein [Nonomuraea sp. NPDC002799]
MERCALLSDCARFFFCLDLLLTLCQQSLPERWVSMGNPFDDTKGSFFVLCNAEGQYSLWPDFAAVPAGWQVICGPDSYEQATVYIEENWTDMRPASLR